jgi:hypothetical protein
MRQAAGQAFSGKTVVGRGLILLRPALRDYGGQGVEGRTNRGTFNPSSPRPAGLCREGTQRSTLDIGPRGQSRTLTYFPQRQFLGDSAKFLNVQAAAFNDAFQGADGNGFAPVHGHDHLPAIFMTPFLVTPGLRHQREAMLPQYFDNFFRVANWKPSAHGTASSINFAPLFILTGAGSNHSSNASFALAMAFASVSPAEAQPGSSGNTADQRLASGSNSTSRRSFMGVR